MCEVIKKTVKTLTAIVSLIWVGIVAQTTRRNQQIEQKLAYGDYSVAIYIL